MVRTLECLLLTVWWTLSIISIGEALPRQQSSEIESALELMTDTLPITSDILYDDITKEFIEALLLENDLLSKLLNAEISKDSEKPRVRRKRLLKMNRNRRSFDSISHATGGFNGQNFAENPTLRRLRELAALHQQRRSQRNGIQSLPHGAEVLFPILQGRLL